MANYATLIAAIQSVITQNGNNEITGPILQQTLISVVNSLGSGYQFIGIATPETTPGTPDQKVFYIGSAGTYPNFGPAVIPDGHLAVLYYDSSWHYGSVAFPLGDGSVTTSKVANGAITYEKLAQGVKDKIEHPVETEDVANSDLDVADENGNVLARFSGGNIKTKKFDSDGVNEKLDTIETGAEVNDVSTDDLGVADLSIIDPQGKILARFINGHIQTKYFNSETAGTRAKIKILALGNSWTCDAFNYVGALINEVLSDRQLDLHIGICYQGGATIQDHYNNLVNNNTYRFYEWVNNGPSWIDSTKAINTILNLDDWDIVFLQHGIINSGDYSTIQPYLNNCMDMISERIQHTVKFGWNLVRAPAGNPSVFPSYTEIAQKMLRETLVQFIIPCGTACENARTTTLDSLGNSGHLTSDGVHLQDGLPCLIEAYAAALFMLSLFGYQQKGINGSTFRPTQAWTDAHGMAGQTNGSVIGLTDANIVLAKKCATIAVDNPFVLTDCSNLF